MRTFSRSFPGEIKMTDRLIPNNTLFSSLLKENPGVSLDQVNQAIDSKIDNLIKNRLADILDEKIKNTNKTWSDILPNGAVNPIGPHGFIFGQKWYPVRNNRIDYGSSDANQLSLSYGFRDAINNVHDDYLAKIGILHVTNGGYHDPRIRDWGSSRQYIVEENFPIFFRYLKRINFPFANIDGRQAYILYYSTRKHDRDTGTTITDYPTRDFYIYVGDAR